jgi:hypothetical protein
MLNGAIELAATELLIYPDGTQQTADGQPLALSFSIRAGASVYLLANLEADAERDGSSADGYNTLTMAFADATGLTSASTLPEPGELPALVLGALALGALRATRPRR